MERRRLRLRLGALFEVKEAVDQSGTPIELFAPVAGRVAESPRRVGVLSRSLVGQSKVGGQKGLEKEKRQQKARRRWV